jgi:transketolase
VSTIETRAARHGAADGGKGSMDERAVTAIRMLAIDGVEQAQSGHPGLPLGAAPMAYALWSRFLRFDPDHPDWPNRDRFVLSAGHGSMLLYALLNLFGYDLPRDELRRFRQWGSKAPGHPEHGLTPGVETTTGPLGQGFATGVGMAIARRLLAHQLNRDGYPVVDWRVFGIVSDGDLMEGVSHEAASLAGHLRLGHLIYLYDDNHISIEGDTAIAFTEDVGQRFGALGWHTVAVEDAENLDAIAAALSEAIDDPRPSLIRVRTHIGYKAPHVQDTPKAHGTPLGAEEARLTRAAYGWTSPPFEVPTDIEAYIRSQADPGRRARTAWTEMFRRYREAYPDAAAIADPLLWGPSAVPVDAGRLPHWRPGDAVATRTASGQVLATLADVPGLVGGSADLAPSNDTRVPPWGDFEPDSPGRNLHFGVREHAMGAALNGMAVSGLRPYGGTFLVFSDYMKPAIRMAALMHLPTVFVFTHDSIGLGEDGPTHQPVEQLAGLRSIPGLWVFRPADANETAVAWRMALGRTDGPVALALTRQKLEVLDPDRHPVHLAAKGAYILSEASGGAPRLLLLATGSEVGLAQKAQRRLEAAGTPTRVVSMPCWELFRQQDASYRDEVLPPHIRARVAVEAASPLPWHEWVGPEGAILGLDHFGASAPYERIFEEFGFTESHLAALGLEVLARTI